MKTKIIIKLDRDLNVLDLGYCLRRVQQNMHYILDLQNIKTKYQVLSHKGGVNVPQELEYEGEVK